MEMQGFARSNVAGEYSPRIYGTVLTTDISNSTTSFVNLLTTTARIEVQGEVLSIFFHGSFTVTTASTPHIQISIDGIVYGGSRQTVGGADATVSRLLNVPNLAPGNHIIKVDFKTNTAGVTVSCKPVTTPTHNSASIVIKSSIINSTEEKGGFPILGWSPHLAEGISYTAFSGTTTNTTTTPATPLLTNLVINTRHAQSAILCKFTACGTQVGTGAAQVKFKLLVDGVSVCGTTAQAVVQTTASVRWNGAMFVLVPVQAGNHTLEIDWCGGSGSGSTIDTTDGFSHAELSVEEVFCPDFTNSTSGNVTSLSLGKENIVSDMGGFATMGFSAKLIPTVTYMTQDVDFTNGSGTNNLFRKLVYVRGDGDSALLIYFSVSVITTTGTSSLLFQTLIDGVVVSATNTTNTVTTGSICLCSTTRLPQGWHVVTIAWTGTDKIQPVTNPDYSHANLVIQEVPNIGW